MWHGERVRSAKTISGVSTDRKSNQLRVSCSSTDGYSTGAVMDQKRQRVLEFFNNEIERYVIGDLIRLS